MGKSNFSDDFKRDAVAQITERGYPVREVSRRLGVSAHSLYAWKKQYGSTRSDDDGKEAEIRRLKRELTRVTEERDILKKAGTNPRGGEQFSRTGTQVNFESRTAPTGPFTNNVHLDVEG